MILVSDRSAKDRENAVARALHQVATVVVDGIDHQLECGIDNRASLFGVEVLLELGRTLDVSEQRRNRLALAIKDRSGSIGRVRADFDSESLSGALWRGGCD